MLFAILLRPSNAGKTHRPIPPWQFPATTRFIAQYSSLRGACVVTMLEAAALESFLLESSDAGVEVRALPVRTPEQGFELARRMIEE